MDTHIHAVGQGLVGAGEVVEELVGRVVVAVPPQVLVEHALLLHGFPDGLAFLQRNPARNEQKSAGRCSVKQAFTSPAPSILFLHPSFLPPCPG